MRAGFHAWEAVIFEHRSCGWPNTGTGQLSDDVTIIRGGGHGKEDLVMKVSEGPRPRTEQSASPRFGDGGG